MDGLLIIDKPSGPTSHDVVARVRRVLRERRIGHTGTLDPMASGVLPLVIGRATRLARFLPGDKAYDADIRLGWNTDTCDAQGEPVGDPYRGAWPDRMAVIEALGQFRGTFAQRPPAFSAKKIDGQRSYALARQARRGAGAGKLGPAAAATRPPALAPVPVTVHTLELLDATDDRIRLHVRCSAGFYVRSLAFDLGEALGTGAHLTGLRRTEAVGFDLSRALPLADLDGEDGPERARAATVPMAQMLAYFPALRLTDDGVRHVGFGRSIAPADCIGGFAEALAGLASTPVVRALAPDGRLVAVVDGADSAGLLHPGVVLL